MTHPARGIHRVVRVVRPVSLGPLEADEPHRVLPPPPPPSAPSVPALDALTLLALWRRFRMVGDVGNAARILAALEKLAERHPHTEGDRDDAADGIRD